MINSNAVLKDYILIIENVMTKFVCDMIINEYENCDEWDCLSDYYKIDISSNNSIDKNTTNRNNIDKLISCSIVRILFNLKITENFRTCGIQQDSGYTLLKISSKYFTENMNLNDNKAESLSCSIQLNEDYDGGEFSFFDREMMIRTKPGSAIVFPSNFMYPHEIMPVIRGTRYSIITWLV
jgi:hypothetical protein